ncbi:HAMP domain-containing sensor histidine kinase [Paralimibaculum aggregatum]|uniref:histidine kinase n=1 Tax=Paralimibaculum aggregatum TaxID=3036245 RepID=A0ABQ6LLB9_9RHOB|nr:ATP-binding protein [Limibaculum sp. NKW23]GMG84001.1 HAMP domain-containing sensor histidine kinase [Limibaculum sp. NKW23]
MRLLPRSLAGQLALLILGAFLAAQVMSVWFFADERGAAVRAAQRLETAERVAAVARALEIAPPASRPGILVAARSRAVRYELADRPLVEADQSGLEAVRSRVRTLLEGARELRAQEALAPIRRWRREDHEHRGGWLRDRLRAMGVQPTELRLSLALSDGQWLNVRARFHRPDFQLGPAVLGTSLLSLLLILVTLWLGLRRITKPLRRLAAAADGFGLDGPPPEMPRGGPREVRALSEALDRMHGRLAGMIAERTRMLAALGHDLRSPITALRLRAEMVDDEETRERMVATLDEMQEMVEATLAFARGVSTDQPMEETDLAAELAGLAAELSETGPRIALAASGPVTVPLRRMPFRRALRNILENAQRYGGGARVQLRVQAGRAEILVDDDGPGIPEADLERVFDPFTRLEPSRSRETGGVGLGLPIARAILRAHGGEVALSRRPGGGLRAAVTLPLPAARTGPAR